MRAFLLMNLEARARLHLNLAPGVGLVMAWRWIQLFGGASAALRAGDDALAATGARRSAVEGALSRDAAEAVDRELLLARKLNIQFAFPGGSEGARAATREAPSSAPLPAELDILEAPPLALRTRGRLELLTKPRTRVAIVGARTPTSYGIDQAARFSSELASRGIVVVSGFARGIDRAAHEAALRCGGDTIAVLGSGLAQPYPSDRPDLVNLINEKGLFISEFAIDTRAFKSNFPQRNRTLAALAVATIVVEAGEQSGSLITARWAEDLGRPVFAIPGRVDSPLSAGCHRLLQNASALLCTSPNEVLEYLGKGGEPVPAAPAPERTPQEQAILDAARAGATLDEIANVWTGPADGLFGVLLSLEFAGAIERLPGGIYRSR